MKPTDLTQTMIDRMPDADRKALGLASTADIDAAASRYEDGVERKMQGDVESWLRLQGYWPRTNGYMTGQAPPRGWYIHLHETRRNPCLLDLLVFRNGGGRWVEIELKTRTGRVRPNQAAIIQATGAPVFRSAQAAIDWLRDEGWAADAAQDAHGNAQDA